MDLSSPVLSLTPGDWKGNDSNWSTFTVIVGGTERFNVLPSIGGSQLWLPDPQLACRSNQTIPDCPSTRGMPNNTMLESTVGWRSLGQYQLLEDPPLFSLFNKADSTFGLGSVQWSNTTGVGNATLDEVLIAAYVYKEYWLGVFGLNIAPTDFEDSHKPASSPLNLLKDAGVIGSLSYGYTAGASYLGGDDGEPGSLTLGGYDESRIQPSGLNLTTGNENQDLRVHLSILTATGDTAEGGAGRLLPEDGIWAVLDSSTAQLWLPPEVCDRIATAFNLRYDANTELYLTDKASRQTLLINNASLTFGIGDGSSSGGSTTIVLPFSSFDLGADQPFYTPRQSYFPLRNATSTSGNVLGRVFLQESYVVVDRERSTFSVSPTTHDVNNTNLVPIPPVNSSSHSTQMAPAGNRPLSRGQTAGIVLSCVVLFAAALALIWWFQRHRTRTRDRKASVEDPTVVTVETVDSSWGKPELMSTETKSGRLLELDLEEADSTQLLELNGMGCERELMSSDVVEMEGDVVSQDAKKDAESGDEKKEENGEEFKDKDDKKPSSVHELE